MKVRFTEQAARQYLEALAFIRTRNPVGAETIQLRVEALIKLLSEQPHSGHPISEFPELPHREHPVPPFRIFYGVMDDTVWVVGLLHNRQRPENLRGTLRGLDTSVERDETDRDIG
jgi:plasmid stabilization system protein ParE